jgi:hypothetical protein
MALIDSIPPFPNLLFEKAGWRGLPLDVLVVRGTFDLGIDGEPMRLAAVQTPLNWGDTFEGPIATDPLAAVLQDAGDLVVGKLSTDVLLTGHLHSPDGKPLTDWVAGVRVGELTKGLRVTGPRRFERGLFGWRITPSEPVTSVALDYRLAFGGHLSLPSKDGLAEIKFPTNPAGTGWLPSASDMKDLSRHQKSALNAWVQSQRVMMAPQFESYNQAITHPADRQMPQGFGPIARWWQPRLSYQGTLDAQWQAERYPNPPDDYNPRYTQSAHPDLITAKLLRGDEEVILSQCLPEARVATRLPGIAVQAMVVFANGHHSVNPLALDTVRINLDTRQCVLVWRTVFDRKNPPVEITVIAMSVEQWRTAVKNKERAEVRP